MNTYIKKFISAILPDSYKPFTMFPYPFKGMCLKVDVGIDESGLPYAEYDSMRVYFPSDMQLDEVETFYRGYLEDEGLTGLGRRTKSPHCYVTEWHRPELGDIIVDVGCSEGFFSRTFAKEAKRIYLFEADPKWSLPLKKTFSGFLEKIIHVPKFVGREISETNIRLVDVVHGSPDEVYFFKLDVEGAEREILESSQDFLRENKIKMSCCSYHRQDDAKYLTRLLQGLGYKTAYSDGWMLPYGSNKFPYFRRGVIYARNF